MIQTTFNSDYRNMTSCVNVEVILYTVDKKLMSFKAEKRKRYLGNCKNCEIFSDFKILNDRVLHSR